MDDLFSRLRASSHQQSYGASPSVTNESAVWSNTHKNYQPPSVSTPLISPPIHTPDPMHPSSVMSPVEGSPAPQRDSAPIGQESKEARLLNLLKSGNSSASQQSNPLDALRKISATGSSDSRSASTSNLAPRNAYGEYLTSPSASNPQDFLLNLLNQKPKAGLDVVQPSSQANRSAATSPPSANGQPAISAGRPSPEAQSDTLHQPRMRVFGSVEPEDTTTFNPPAQGLKQNGQFNYVNPFEVLSTPRATPIVNANDHGNGRIMQGDSILNSVEDSPGKNQSVAQALNNVGGEVDMQVKKALAQADHPHPTTETATHDKSIKRQKTADDVIDSWESADMADENEKKGNPITVYNLPLRPFIAIKLKAEKARSLLRPSSLMDIARMKKDFDQVDRNLVAATDSHIVYATAKNGGLRIISQDSGRDKQVFRNGQERIVHVQVTTDADKATDNILATGIDGTTYLTSIGRSVADFDDADPEGTGLILPPIPVTSEDNTSNGPIKTRAKLSSRHLGISAISRGKAIYIVSHEIATASYVDNNTRRVNSVKYVDERGLKISTSKSCKDFAFSEDDTMLATLDKAGRIKFWDIRPLIDAAVAKKPGNMEQKDPILTLVSAAPDEKLSPTSIMFLDRERPYTRGAALRYALLGFRQNHIIQLWDLAIGKAVQEIQLPHDNDLDAICSVNYDPVSSMVAIGHPTRNSIFYAYLSTPRYQLATMDQARYMTLLASNDPSIPKPDSTAIIGSIREVSFESKGALRSIEMCRTPAAANNDTAEDSKALFELYAMHAKGVTCISVAKQDLGLDANNKAISPVDGLESGYLSVVPLGGSSTDVPSAAAEVSPAKSKTATASTKSSDAQRSSSTIVKQRAVDEAPKSISKDLPVHNRQSSAKRSTSETKFSIAGTSKTTTPESFVVIGNGSSENETAADKTTIKTGDKTEPAHSDAHEQLSSVALTNGFEQLYRKIDDDRRVQDAAANARQSAVLELVSSTLTENVERSLGAIVSNSIQTKVMPALIAQTSSILDKQIKHELSTNMASQFKSALGDAKVLKLLSDAIVPKVSDTLRQTLTSSIVPQISQIAATTTQKAITESEARVAAQLKDIEQQRRSDEIKLERLHSLVAQLSDTITAMASGQHAFQEQILAQRRAPSDARSAAAGHDAAIAERLARQPEPVIAVTALAASVEQTDEELATVARLLLSPNPENAMFEWVRNVPRHRDIFEVVLHRYEPRRLPKLDTVLVLSVLCVLVEDDWTDSRLSERLVWLRAMFACLSSEDLAAPELVAAVPRVMSKIWTQLRNGYSKLQASGQCSPAELDAVAQLCAHMYKLAPSAIA